MVFCNWKAHAKANWNSGTWYRCSTGSSPSDKALGDGVLEHHPFIHGQRIIKELPVELAFLYFIGRERMGQERVEV